MGIDNDKVTLGNYLKATREAQGLSKNKLIALSKGGITWNTLTTLEAGTGNSSQETIACVFRILGKSMEDYLEESGLEVRVRFINDTNQIDNFIQKNQLATAKECYHHLLAQTYYNRESSRVKQQFAYYDGIFLAGINGEKEQANELLKKMLLEMYPGLFIRKKGAVLWERFDFEFITQLSHPLTSHLLANDRG